jgi:hypothetical protein
MQLTAIPFGTTDWSQIEPVAHPGEVGTAYWHLPVRQHPCATGGVQRATSPTIGAAGHILLYWRASWTPNWTMVGASRSRPA